MNLIRLLATEVAGSVTDVANEVVSNAESVDLAGISGLDLFYVIGFIILGILFAKFSRSILKRIIKKDDAARAVDGDEEIIESAEEDGEPIKIKKPYSVKRLIAESLFTPLNLFCLSVVSALGLMLMNVPNWGTEIWTYIELALKSLSIIYLAWTLINITRHLWKKLKYNAKKTETKQDDILVPVAIVLFQFLIVLLAFLMIIRFFGVSVPDFIASTGIGGIVMRSINNVIIIFGCVILSIIADRVTCRIIQHVGKRKAESPIAQRRKKIWNLVTEALSKPLHWFYLTVGCSLGLLVIDKPDWAGSIWSFLLLGMKAISIWCVIWFLLNITESVTKIMNERAKATESKLDDMLVPIASSAVKFLLFAMGILVILQNMGYSVTALIGGLGIGAGVVALASKDTIANMFGALVVFFDKPFEIGDWVEINGVEGAVEEIRLRVTLIRTFDGTLVTIPNSALSNTNINNWQVRQYRKMECGFGLLYSTKSEQIRKIVEDIKTHIKSHPETFGPEFYVNFDGFGDSSFDIRVEAFTRNEGRSKHLADKQEFMLEIVRIVEDAGTGFAFPTRTLDMPMSPIRIKMDRE